MRKGVRMAFRLGSMASLAAATVWAVNVVQQANGFDDGGPALGALFMSVPSIILLVAAGALWSAGSKPGAGGLGATAGNAAGTPLPLPTSSRRCPDSKPLGPR